MAIIVANGRFDVLHAGHFNLLSYCRKLAGEHGILAVLIDSDWRIKQSNPMLPIFSQDVREANLRLLKDDFRFKGNEGATNSLVDIVEIFDTDEDLIRLIKEIKPDFLVKGSDWANKPVIGSDIARLLLFKTESNGMSEKISSSEIIKTIIDRYEHRKIIGEGK